VEIQKSQIILYVRDQAASAAFYAGVLELSPALDVPGMTEFELSPGAVLGLMLETGIRRLLGERLPPFAAVGGAKAELYLVVEDAQAALERALAAGGKLLSELALRDWGQRVGYCLDLDGYVLAFAEV
jgi:catechol 2,3-dioxygenase-like lactoylglutathione lyase family enzyme